jgi:hypothetical protein
LKGRGVGKRKRGDLFLLGKKRSAMATFQDGYDEVPSGNMTEALRYMVGKVNQVLRDAGGEQVVEFTIGKTFTAGSVSRPRPGPTFLI